MIDPPIDKLIDQIGCKYALVKLVVDRAHQLQDKHYDRLEAAEMRPVSMAAQEIYEGKVVLLRD